MKFFAPQKPGFTLLELMIALGIAAVVITTAMGTVGQIYTSQNRISVSQDFYNETRFLLERIVGTIRENTLDYDRFFVIEGPDPATTACPSFQNEQTPDEDGDSDDRQNEEVVRERLKYPNIFYWDTNKPADGVQDRQRGGLNLEGAIDACSEAFTGAQNPIYLINRERNTRRAIIYHANLSSTNPDYSIQLETQIAADTDGDGLADIWAPFDDNKDGDTDDTGDTRVIWDGVNCQIEIPDGTSTPPAHDFLGDKTSESACLAAHLPATITPSSLLVQNLTFTPYPTRDPFLAFKVPSAQIHPYVFISMEAEMKNPENFGFTDSTAPKIQLQTAASSRVFGDTRR